MKKELCFTAWSCKKPALLRPDAVISLLILTRRKEGHCPSLVPALGLLLTEPVGWLWLLPAVVAVLRFPTDSVGLSFPENPDYSRQQAE